MATCNEFLEQAITLAKQELKCLKEEDLDGVEQLCSKRSKLMAQAFEQAGKGGDSLSRSRLERLQEIQEEMTGVATELRAKVKQLILSGNRQKTCFQGYGKANTYTPKIQNRFISKRG